MSLARMFPRTKTPGSSLFALGVRAIRTGRPLPGIRGWTSLPPVNTPCVMSPECFHFYTYLNDAVTKYLANVNAVLLSDCGTSPRSVVGPPSFSDNEAPNDRCAKLIKTMQEQHTALLSMIADYEAQCGCSQGDPLA